MGSIELCCKSEDERICLKFFFCLYTQEIYSSTGTGWAMNGRGSFAVLSINECFTGCGGWGFCKEDYSKQPSRRHLCAYKLGGPQHWMSSTSHLKRYYMYVHNNYGHPFLTSLCPDSSIDTRARLQHQQNNTIIQSGTVSIREYRTMFYDAAAADPSYSVPVKWMNI